MTSLTTKIVCYFSVLQQFLVKKSKIKIKAMNFSLETYRINPYASTVVVSLDMGSILTKRPFRAEAEVHA